MMFKCPSCKRFHSKPEHYDQQEYICVDSSTSQLREQRDLTPSDLLERNEWNRNVYSTKEDAYREVTIVDAELLPNMNRYTGKKRSTFNW